MTEGALLGVSALTWQAALMLGLGGLLVYLGIGREIEPLLLVPIGMGVILANIPLGGLTEGHGLLAAPAQFGIFATFFLAYLVGDGGLRWFDFTFSDAVAIGIIGSADGPTSIYV